MGYKIISDICNMIITGATGTMSKLFRKIASKIPVNHDVEELHETAILGTAHIIR